MQARAVTQRRARLPPELVCWDRRESIPGAFHKNVLFLRLPKTSSDGSPATTSTGNEE